MCKILATGQPRPALPAARHPERMVKPDLPGYQDLFADEDKALEALDKIAASRLSDCPYQVVEVTYFGDLRSRWSSAPCT